MSATLALLLAAHGCGASDASHELRQRTTSYQFDIMSPSLLRAAVEEYIRMGPESRRPALERLAERLPQHDADEHSAALAQARNAAMLAEQLAREYQNGTRTQKEAEAELRRQLPWLIDESGKDHLVKHLGSFGYYLAIN